ncbi:C2 domain protein [Teladorsagia circumcincta]|uniref:C2 domain protein n=1 Tax=Teladorsagia circumcincta TaxID=45464 RepID=A0A2G9UCC3_TELCI|nr:C2 domain protein [Teladorsagia circumcincta]
MEELMKENFQRNWNGNGNKYRINTVQKESSRERLAERKKASKEGCYNKGFKSSRDATVWRGVVANYDHRYGAMERQRNYCYSGKRKWASFPAVLHVRMWFGRRGYDWSWKEYIQPAEIKPYFELFSYQRRPKLSSQWKDEQHYTNERDTEDLSEFTTNSPYGWNYMGNWVVRNTHDMWVCSSDGRQTFEDKLFEVHERRKGKPDHKYRRRCIKRTRKAIDFQNQNFDAYQESLGDTKWEYAAGKKKPFHYQETSGDCIRRRRFVMEMQRQKNLPRDREHEMYFIPRMYEAHETTTTWQLRCYFLWAKDLLPVVKNSARAFIRVTFLTKAKQTLVIEDSQNPVWNETLIFDRVGQRLSEMVSKLVPKPTFIQMLIPGGKRQISVNPPTVLVETRGEQKNGSEIFLGRFQTNPTVICTGTDSRAILKWNTLTFQFGRSRGAVLGCCELFCEDKSTKDSLPLLPMRKAVE